MRSRLAPQPRAPRGGILDAPPRRSHTGSTKSARQQDCDPASHCWARSDAGRRGRPSYRRQMVTAEILQRRAEIERQISGSTVCDLLERIAGDEGEAPAFSDEAGNGWQTLTWAQAHQRVRQ